MEYSRQCYLEKKEQDELRCQVSWIPEKFAKMGKVLKLLDNDNWVDGWRIVGVGARKLSKEVSERSQDYKKQRPASDI